MEIIFLPTALADLQHWKESGNTIILKRIRQLLEAIQQTPFSGIGKPEALKHNWRANGLVVLIKNTASSTKSKIILSQFILSVFIIHE
jgi:hypothetical protein